MKSVLIHASQFVAGMSMMFSLAGCDRTPTRAEAPPYDPAAIAQGALAAYDTNGDGAVAGDELKKAASITDHPELSVKLIDKNGDGKIDKDEIQSRVQTWIDSQVGILTFNCTVTLDGRPLEGATVRYVPETFMGGAIEEASGTTNATGSVVLAIAQDKLPAHLKGINGMHSGFYKIEITHPTKKIPASYNTETILGQEIASDNIGRINVVHALKSR